MTPDLINGCFELIGGIFLWSNVYRLYKDKQVKGVNPTAVLFFASWGIWNLWYYPNLDQWWSFYGGLVIASANAVWLMQVAYYTRKRRRDAP